MQYHSIAYYPVKGWLMIQPVISAEPSNRIIGLPHPLIFVLYHAMILMSIHTYTAQNKK